MLKNLLLTISILGLLSCGKSTDEKVDAAVLGANIALSKGNCQTAIDELESVGRQDKHARYLKTLASAYACKAGYSVVTFFASDIAKSATPAPLGGATLYSTSQATVTGALADDEKFNNLQMAIDILLYAGGLASTAEPFATTRATHFTADEAADINSQLLFMMMAQLGKYMHYYADTSTTGIKGSGILPNTCFMDYSAINADDPAAVTGLLAANGGACVAANAGHVELDPTTAAGKKKLCHGVVLLNGIIDLLPSIVVAAGGTELGSVSTLTAQITAFKNLVDDFFPEIATVFTTVNQSTCETSPAITVKALEAYFIGTFESLVK